MVITPDGKPFVIQLASSLQETHGNDFWLPRHREIRAGQQYSAGQALANSNTDLPFMAFIDKGFTAQGVYELIRMPGDRNSVTKY
ncbi:hypothetical protein ACLBOM_36620 [Escherichia coli]